MPLKLIKCIYCGLDTKADANAKRVVCWSCIAKKKFLSGADAEQGEIIKAKGAENDGRKNN